MAVDGSARDGEHRSLAVLSEQSPLASEHFNERLAVLTTVGRIEVFSCGVSGHWNSGDE